MQFKRNLKHIFFISCITISLIIAVIRLFSVAFLPITHFFVYRENLTVLNALYTYRFTPSPDIVIIKIDDETLNSVQAHADLKTLTLGKTLYTELIDKLESVGVKGIAFDIVFQNADPEEEKFAETLTKNKNIVIASMDGEGAKCILDTTTPYETCDGLPRSVYSGAVWGAIANNVEGDRKSITQDISGVLSRSSTLKNKIPIIDTLALALYKTSSGEALPFGSGSAILSPFFGIPGVYRSISLAEVLRMSKIDLISNFGGKYIFVGESGTIIHDQHISPVSGTMIDGVETHAHFLDGLLQKRFLKSFDAGDPLFWGVLLLLVSMMITIYTIFSKYTSLFLTIFLTIFLVWTSRYLYFHSGIVLEIFPLLLAISILSFPITFIYRFFIVDREKRMLTSVFAHYLDPELVKEIAENAESIKLGGEARELSVLFSDIAGFTTISEKTPVKELFMLMSNYLSRMTGILITQGGTLDKYIGDAVMGFFGAPLVQEDHARRACQTALDMRSALPVFNADLVSRGIDPIDFRVGIASGEVLVGNIGSQDRFNYTVLGDTVNLASRLEATSKEYGTHIIVSEGTYTLVKEQFKFRKLDLLTVKGKNEAVGIYELIAPVGNLEIDTSWYDEYERAFALYADGQYLEAGKIWEAQMHIDPPSGVMAHRCHDILQGLLVVENGVYHMTHK